MLSINVSEKKTFISDPISQPPYINLTPRIIHSDEVVIEKSVSNQI